MGYHHPINNFDINFRSTLVPFQFTKTDNALTPQSGLPLPDAVFRLYRRADSTSPWVAVGLPAASNASGVVSFNLTPAGQYRLVEVLAPVNFDTPFGYWILTMTPSGNTYTVTAISSQGGNPNFVQHPITTGNWYVGNRPGIDLPMTGARGITIFAISGSFVLVVAGLIIGLMVANKKKQAKMI